MKRGLIILALLLLIVPTILAEENITERAKEQLSALRGGLDAKTENVLERIVTVPPFLKVPLRLILGIEEDATWQQLIVVLGVFIGFFILIFSITDFLPFFKKDLIKVAASLVITTLVSITSALDTMATFFFDAAGFFKWTAAWGPLQMIVAILLAIIIVIAFNRIAKKIKNKLKIEKAGEVGERLKEGSENAKIMTEGIAKFSK